MFPVPARADSPSFEPWHSVPVFVPRSAGGFAHVAPRLPAVQQSDRCIGPVTRHFPGTRYRSGTTAHAAKGKKSRYRRGRRHNAHGKKVLTQAENAIGSEGLPFFPKAPAKRFAPVQRNAMLFRVPERRHGQNVRAGSRASRPRFGNHRAATAHCRKRRKNAGTNFHPPITPVSLG